MTIAIADNGIDEENLDRIFDQFNQIEEPYTKRHRGIGLGLPTSTELCERIGLELHVESVGGPAR